MAAALPATNTTTTTTKRRRGGKTALDLYWSSRFSPFFCQLQERANTTIPSSRPRAYRSFIREAGWRAPRF